MIIGPEYTSTKAVSGYEDYAGSLDLKAEIKEIYLSIRFRQYLNQSRSLQPLLGFNVGLTHFTYSEEETLNIKSENIYQSNNSEVTDYGYTLEALAGITTDIDFAILEVIISYRYVSLENMLIQPDNINIRFGIKKGIFNKIELIFPVYFNCFEADQRQTTL